MKKIRNAILVIAVFSVLFASGCTFNVKFPEPEKGAALRPLIIDTDAGADDAMAITIAVRSGRYDIKGITVVAGNVSTEQAAKNVLMILENLGRSDIPVYLGSSTVYSDKAVFCFSVFGEDGMGDAGLIHPTGKAKEENGVDFIIRTARENKGDLEILSVGTATNIALAIDKDPDAMQGIKRIWSMGTSGFGPGNATPVAEFNVYNDAPAYKVMLDSGIPITVAGLDTVTEDLWFDKADMEKMSSRSEYGKFIATASRKLMEYNVESIGQYIFDAYDPMAAIAATWDELVTESVLCSATCITDDTEAFGEVIFYRTDRVYDSAVEAKNPHVTVITKFNTEKLKDKMMEILSR